MRNKKIDINENYNLVDLPLIRGSAKSSSSIITPSKTFIMGGISNNFRLIGCSGPKIDPDEM